MRCEQSPHTAWRQGPIAQSVALVAQTVQSLDGSSFDGGRGGRGACRAFEPACFLPLFLVGLLAAEAEAEALRLRERGGICG